MRAAKNIRTSEIFIETPLRLWKQVLSVWKKNHKNPCPMPKGHLMFSGKLPDYKSGWWLLGQFVEG